MTPPQREEPWRRGPGTPPQRAKSARRGPRTRAYLFAAIFAVILFVTTGGPWSTFVGHSHWALVEWVPFSGGIYPFDIVANVALFVPLGLALAWGRRGRHTILVATLTGALLSLSIEVFQVYTHGRLATITDVLTNTCGTAIGASLAARRFNRGSNGGSGWCSHRGSDISSGSDDSSTAEHPA